MVYICETFWEYVDSTLALGLALVCFSSSSCSKVNLLAMPQCLHLDPGSSVEQKRAYILRACPYLGLSPKTFTRGIPEALSLIRSLHGMGAIKTPRLFSRSFIALVSIRGKFGVESGSLQLGSDKERLVSDDPAVVVSCMQSLLDALRPLGEVITARPPW